MHPELLPVPLVPDTVPVDVAGHGASVHVSASGSGVVASMHDPSAPPDSHTANPAAHAATWLSSAVVHVKPWFELCRLSTSVHAVTVEVKNDGDVEVGTTVPK